MTTENTLPKGQIVPVDAPSEGGLPGFAYRCPTCDDVIAYSLETMTASEAAKHRAWHAGSRRAWAPVNENGWTA